MAADGLQLFGELNAEVFSASGFVVLSADNDPLATVEWQQLSGPPLHLLAAHTQAIGFDLPASGQYELAILATTASGAQRQLRFTLEALASSDENRAAIRLDHMATERGRVSLRVDSDTSKIITDIVWEQLAGPTVNDIEYQADVTAGPLHSAFFAAPEVDSDEVMVFAATLTFDDGATASDKVYVGINDAPTDRRGIFTQNEQFVTTDMQPYRADSPWAQALKRCVYTNLLTDSCSFAELPLIGMQTQHPDIDTILDKTLVSHPWMGDRFAEFLRQSATAEDMLNLLRGVTAIVISYDIRPSFYWVRTGAIYLDARNFWRTPAERDTLNTAPDYRSNFGDELQFGIYWRYVKNNQYYYPQPALAESQRNSRDLAQSEAALAWLLYHELAHANDFFPPAAWAGIDSNQTPLSYFQRNPANSTRLDSFYPLQSAALAGLAQVSFGGASAAVEQRQFTPAQAADEFSADIAPAYYAYYTEREDFATLFERFMMLYRLNVSADAGVIGQDDNPDALLTWGQRDRINQDSLQARTAFVVERILPQLNVAQLQSQLPGPQPLRAGVSWYDFAALTEQSGVLLRLNRATSEQFRPPLQQPLADHHLRY
ncbi:hypothetical protein BFC17_17290 [Alteromonas lipolytica]|uniref:Uncharacterized protein n=1 Tax=Alteromonas lipolytica TaxID=1856405 RepID=A0A1E8FI20_9ALTE|nr:hypothetical protein BFC17_17290 [Alteromonas lipolytica]